MTEITTYEPLTLSRVRTGGHVGTVRLYGGTYRVEVSSHDKRYYRVRVVAETGTLVGKVYTDAGMLRRDGRSWQVNSYDADSKSQGSGYTESGTMARNAERVVAEFLEARHSAAQEAAKTPEERQAEAEARAEQRKANISKNQRAQIERAARDLLALVDDFVDAEALEEAGLTPALAVNALRGSLDQMVRNLDFVPMTGEWS